MSATAGMTSAATTSVSRPLGSSEPCPLEALLLQETLSTRFGGCFSNQLVLALTRGAVDLLLPPSYPGQTGGSTTGYNGNSSRAGVPLWTFGLDERLKRSKGELNRKTLRRGL